MSATLKTKFLRIFNSIDISLSIIHTNDILTCKKSSKVGLENKNTIRIMVIDAVEGIDDTRWKLLKSINTSI